MNSHNLHTDLHKLNQIKSILASQNTSDFEEFITDTEIGQYMADNNIDSVDIAVEGLIAKIKKYFSDKKAKREAEEKKRDDEAKLKFYKTTKYSGPSNITPKSIFDAGWNGWDTSISKLSSDDKFTSQSNAFISIDIIISGVKEYIDFYKGLYKNTSKDSLVKYMVSYKKKLKYNKIVGNNSDPAQFILGDMYNHRKSQTVKASGWLDEDKLKTLTKSLSELASTTSNLKCAYANTLSVEEFSELDKFVKSTLLENVDYELFYYLGNGDIGKDFYDIIYSCIIKDIKL